MATDVQTCYRHDQRRAGVLCQRCDRPICPDCMTQASVGFHCPSCVAGSNQRVYTARTLPSMNAAPVTAVLVAVNVAVYIWSSLARGLQGLSIEVQVDYALLGEGFSRIHGPIGVAEGEWYRLITGGFLHGGLLHLGFNMYVLWLLGRQLEGAVGRVAFSAVYGASLLAGALGVMVMDPFAYTVGASGAVFGLFGYAAVGQLSRGVNPMQTGLGGIVVLNLLITFLVPNISIGGHLGGLIGGAVAGLLHEILRRKVHASAAVGIGMVTAFGLACGVASVLAVA